MLNSSRSVGGQSVNVLLIIDMQTKFLEPEAVYQPIINTTLNEIYNARVRNDYILIVEYDYNTRITGMINGVVGSVTESTHQSIIGAVSGYPHLSFVFKKEMGGGSEVQQTMRDKGITSNKFRVCGVYAPWCVKETVMQLRSLVPTANYELVRNGIASCLHNIKSRELALADMSHYGINVV